MYRADHCDWTKWIFCGRHIAGCGDCQSDARVFALTWRLKGKHLSSNAMACLPPLFMHALFSPLFIPQSLSQCQVSDSKDTKHSWVVFYLLACSGDERHQACKSKRPTLQHAHQNQPGRKEYNNTPSLLPLIPFPFPLFSSLLSTRPASFYFTSVLCTPSSNS